MVYRVILTSEKPLKLPFIFMEPTDLDIGESPKRNSYDSAIQKMEEKNSEANELGDIVLVLTCMTYFSFVSFDLFRNLGRRSKMLL